MYTSMKDMLLHARDHQYAVMAVNVVNMEQVKACIESAVEEHSGGAGLCPHRIKY